MLPAAFSLRLIALASSVFREYAGLGARGSLRRAYLEREEGAE